MASDQRGDRESGCIDRSSGTRTQAVRGFDPHDRPVAFELPDRLRAGVTYFFRRRLALATARLCQGASTEAMDAPPLEISLSPDVAAAKAFSRTIRWYSAGEHLFCATSRVRRAIVSHDAIIRSVIIIGSDTVLRRLRVLMTNALSDDECGTTALST